MKDIVRFFGSILESQEIMDRKFVPGRLRRKYILRWKPILTIEKAGFKFEKEINVGLIHDNERVEGVIMNFRKI